MKKLFFALLIAYSFSAFSKEYTEIIYVENKNFDQLYQSIEEWAIQEPRYDINKVVKVWDVARGKFVIDYYSEIKAKCGRLTVPMKYKFSLSVFIKDGKYKYLINDIYLTDSDTSIETFESLKNGPNIRKKRLMFFNSILYNVGADIDVVLSDIKSKMSESKNEEIW